MQPTPGRDRAYQLLQDLSDLDRLAAKSGYAKSLRESRDAELRKIVNPIFSRIDRYCEDFIYGLRLDLPGEAGWTKEYILPRSVQGNPEAEAYLFGLWILEAAFNGSLRRVLRCPNCRRWFKGLRKDHKYCSGKCREKAFRRSSEGRTKRAAYMRRYRAGLKRRDRENLKLRFKKER